MRDDTTHHSDLRNFKNQAWLMEYSEGEGFENYQIVLGVVVALIASFVIWVISSSLPPAIGFGMVIGFAAARLPNYINSHYKHPRRYLQDLLKKYVQRFSGRMYIVNDERMLPPPETSERYEILVVHRDFSEEVGKSA